jgi:hypothetical protein
MQDDRFKQERRMTLQWLLAGGTIGLMPIPALIRSALAMGAHGYTSAMQKVTGDVKLNALQAQVGTPVNYGDVVSTGHSSRAIFILGESVFLVREKTRLELPAKRDKSFSEKTAGIIRLTGGKVLAVLGRGRLRFTTPTAVVGIRGTGLYLEASPNKTYVCLCYGKASLSSRITGKPLEDIKTRHHDSPRYIYKSPLANGSLIEKAPVVNHTDAELILLESMVGRKPPFINSGKYY